MTTILALDASSTTLGWCVLAPGRPPLAKTIVLGSSRDDIALRCLRAQQELALLIAASAPDAIAIEKWVWRFPNTTIPQVLVQGALLAELQAHNLAYAVIQPSEGKQALTGAGVASKREMLEAAAPHFGYDTLLLRYEERRGLWYAVQCGAVVYDEHAADALGIAIAAVGRVVVEAVA